MVEWLVNTELEECKLRNCLSLLRFDMGLQIVSIQKCNSAFNDSLTNENLSTDRSNSGAKVLYEAMWPA
jgi:arginine decarboxylase-like protein